MKTAQDYIEIVAKSAVNEGISADLACAVASVESSWNPYAVRFEPQWRYFLKIDEYARRNLITADTEKQLQAMSFGLMQVMGSVCRELGHQSSLLQLADAETGARYGCKKLAQFLKKHGNEQDAIAAYNAGSPRIANGKYENQQYVDKVNKVLTEMRRYSKK